MNLGAASIQKKLGPIQCLEKFLDASRRLGGSRDNLGSFSKLKMGNLLRSKDFKHKKIQDKLERLRNM